MGRRYWPLRRPRGRGALALLAAVAVLVIGGVAAGAVAVASGPPPIGIRNLRIPVVDGPGHNQHVVLDATFFTPAGGGRVPAILLAHGFGETKDAVSPEAQQLARAGFAVLTWSARGMGRSTGQIALDAPAYEVTDVEQLVTWLARQPRVLLDHPGDPRVGIAGASYGGAIALLAAAYDHRIDAIVPQVTWNNLATALFPNAAGGSPLDGVFKRQWAGLLFTEGVAGLPASLSPAERERLQAQAAQGGAAQARVAQEIQCGRFLPQVCAAYQQAATLGRATPQMISLLEASSPASVAGRIDVPTLLIQGENDSLFGLDQANANYQAIRRNGAPVDMVWFAGGHDGGNQEASRLTDLTQAWFDRWLMPPNRPWRPGSRPAASARQGQPAFAVTRVRGFDPATDEQVLDVATAPGYPGLNGTRRAQVSLSGPAQPVVNPAGGAPPSISVFPGAGSLGAAGDSGISGGGLAFDVPGQSAFFQSAPLRAPLQVTGSMTVRIRVAGTAQVTLFAKVYDVDQAGNATLPFSLAAPLRVTNAGSGRVVTVTLPAIDYQFAAGHRLRLVLTATDFAYATPAAPATYLVALAGRGLTVPSDPALAVSGTGVPWWTWAAPAVALLASALILITGRRRGQGDAYRQELAGVPLEITGLTKHYRDGQLAVDDLSLRVERGQILGLLGPNGAGKTTTLRALMGLLHPDAGTITIFGHQVHAGSAALSRLGAFVEGPGFLPHLSGRANLEMYWRAAGRTGTDSHAEEVMAIAGLGTAIDRPVRAYSRGMCQRLAIAQAMLGLPDLLVLDEPMNGLDPPQIREMRDVLLGYAARGRTVILSSHMLAEVEQTCSHVVVMHLGRVVAAGPVAEITGAGAGLIVGTPEGSRAVSVLARLDGLDGAEPHQDGVLVRTNGVPASAVVAALVGAGIPVERVTPNRRLEDAFLALIGQPAADTEGAR
jgi:ABC-2 type transport system ATP-binding protein